jgi:hypothetical protein
MSPPSTKNAAFENSTTSREAAPTAVETRSEFRYRIEASHPHLAHGAAAPVGLGPPDPPLLKTMHKKRGI